MENSQLIKVGVPPAVSGCASKSLEYVMELVEGLAVFPRVCDEPLEIGATTILGMLAHHRANLGFPFVQVPFWVLGRRPVKRCWENGGCYRFDFGGRVAWVSCADELIELPANCWVLGGGVQDGYGEIAALAPRGVL
jgi:hypothetical protein